ncbi:MAG TPA: serine/threonine-protein kinase [Polyangia bacterium]|nr:serine/threonine-protein kinase [Polyangia bacterium]
MGCVAENTLLGFVEGHLDAASIAEVEAHAKGCALCQRLVDAALAMVAPRSVTEAATSPRAPRLATLARGGSFGRYTVLELAGRGGMSDVYAAYDPSLDRKIALKLLHGSAGAGLGQERLLREAKAIAKLSHPNVVVVHEVGNFEGRLFIAMEFLSGATLKDWLAEAPRTRAAIQEVFAQAARGLSAAHAVGLVHRDFKPQNVMVTRDGAVRVMDFGLARQIDDDAHVAESAHVASPSDTTVAAASGFLKLTQTGALLGTPAYMAPEQFAAGSIDARTDQFSFCVALYEALYGQRPFGGDTLSALMVTVTGGAVNAAPPGARVPTWLRRVMLRGLQTNPELRFPSMTELLTALHVDPMIRVRRAALGLTIVACLAGAALGARRLSGAQRPLCLEGANRLADVWEPAGSASARKDRIHLAFEGSGKSYAEQAFAGASRLLDEYVARWLSMYRDTCEATHVRGEQSTEVLDLRMSCLQERLTEVRALTDVFTAADGDTVENAVAATSALPRLDHCADVALLKAVIQPPRDEATRARVAFLGGERARLVALRDSGHCRAAEELATRLLPVLRTTGYLPLLGQTLSVAGLMSNDCAASAQGIAWEREAYSIAVESHDDEVAAEAATMVSAYLGDRARKSEEARTWLDIARASNRRIGSRPLLEAWALVAEGHILLDEGRYAAAIAAYQRGFEIKKKVLGEHHLDVVISMNNIGNALQRAGRLDEALASYRSVAAEFQRILGTEHPYLGYAFNNEGEILNLLHRPTEARPAFQRALAVLQGSAADAEIVAYPLTGLGIADLGEGRPADAVAPLEKALRLRSQREVAADLVGETRFALARALWSLPVSRARALALARAARADYAQVKTGAPTVAVIDAWLRSPSDHL